MNINIEIDEKRITELVENDIAKYIYQNYSSEAREAGYGVRTGIDKAVKQYIYDKKENIIERVIERAKVEIIRKALPRLLENVKDSI